MMTKIKETAVEKSFSLQFGQSRGMNKYLERRKQSLYVGSAKKSQLLGAVGGSNVDQSHVKSGNIQIGSEYKQFMHAPGHLAQITTTR